MPDLTLAEPATESDLNACRSRFGASWPTELDEFLARSDGARTASGADVVVSAAELVARNRELRETAGFAELYMSFEQLLFFGESGNGDLYAVKLAGEPVVMRWDHETDERVWIASSLAELLDREPWSEGDGFSTSHVHQLRLVVETEDFETALAFYRDSLGLAVELDLEGDEGEHVVILEAGRATLELSNPAQVAMIDRVEVGRRVAPRLRVAFEVDDTAVATDVLVAAGAELVAPPTRTPWDSVNSRLEAPAGLQITLFEETIN